MSRRTLEQLKISKQKKVTVANGYPSPTEGANGEIQIRNTSDNGPMLFLKANNRWYYAALQLKPVGKNRERTILKQGRPAKFPGELAMTASGAITFKKSGDSDEISLLDSGGSSGNLTLQSAGSDEAYLEIKGGVTNGDAAIYFYPDKATDPADKFKIYAQDADTVADGLRFAKMNSGTGAWVDIIKMTYGSGDAEANSQIGLYAPVVCSNTLQATVLTSTVNGECSGTGALDTGSSNITTTGTVSGATVISSELLRSQGTIISTSPTITAAGSSDYSIGSTQVLNDTSASLGTQEYRQISTELTATDITGWDNVYLIDQQVGGASKFNVTSTGNATFAGSGAFSELTSGAVIWQYFPFITSFMTTSRGHYFRDVDDQASPHEKWDAYDADMSLDYRAFYGFFCVPEDCTLVAWHGKVANTGVTTANPTISVYHATPRTDTAATSFSLAGSASVVSIATARLTYDYSGTCDVDLTAGDLVVPTIKHADASSQGYCGSITLKFITR